MCQVVTGEPTYCFQMPSQPAARKYVGTLENASNPSQTWQVVNPPRVLTNGQQLVPVEYVDHSLNAGKQTVQYIQWHPTAASTVLNTSYLANTQINSPVQDCSQKGSLCYATPPAVGSAVNHVRQVPSTYSPVPGVTKCSCSHSHMENKQQKHQSGTQVLHYPQENREVLSVAQQPVNSTNVIPAELSGQLQAVMLGNKQYSSEVTDKPNQPGNKRDMKLRKICIHEIQEMTNSASLRITIDGRKYSGVLFVQPSNLPLQRIVNVESTTREPSKSSPPLLLNSILANHTRKRKVDNTSSSAVRDMAGSPAWLRNSAKIANSPQHPDSSQQGVDEECEQKSGNDSNPNPTKKRKRARSSKKGVVTAVGHMSGDDVIDVDSMDEAYPKSETSNEDRPVDSSETGSHSSLTEGGNSIPKTRTATPIMFSGPSYQESDESMSSNMPVVPNNRQDGGVVNPSTQTDAKQSVHASEGMMAICYTPQSHLADCLIQKPFSPQAQRAFSPLTTVLMQDSVPSANGILAPGISSSRSNSPTLVSVLLNKAKQASLSEISHSIRDNNPSCTLKKKLSTPPGSPCQTLRTGTPPASPMERIKSGESMICGSANPFCVPEGERWMEKATEQACARRPEEMSQDSTQVSPTERHEQPLLDSARTLRHLRKKKR